jgi:2',3'-cyclic-nucleotide 2'-phosphodiesterase (5'-nucleotidase family)
MNARLFTAIAATLVMSCTSLQQPDAPARFKILQLNDVYKIEGLARGEQGGLARVRTLRKQLEADGSAVLVLHGGDALYPSVMSKYLAAEQMIDVMNLLDGDEKQFDPGLIAGFGNHEFDNKDANVLLSRLRQSHFQWLATNTRRCNPECTEKFPSVEEFIVRDVGRTRIGLFGLLYAMQKPYAKSSDVLEAARLAVDTLKGRGADVIIAITHQDMPDDINLVKTVPGIDLVIGGHDHLFMQEQVNGTWITKADADAKSVVVYDVRMNGDDVEATPQRVMLDATIAPDPMVVRRVKEWQARLDEKLGGNEVYGKTTYLLEGTEPAVRGRESALGNLLTDAARAQMGTDVAILNGGSIRINDDIPAGDITELDMEGIFYYTNELVAFRATGQQLLDLLRHGVSRADAGDGRFLQVSGVRFTYAKEGDAYVIQPADVTVGGAPLDLNATYTVATIDYLLNQGDEDGFALFSDANRPARINTEREADFRKTVESYIRTRGTVSTNVEGRIVRR